MEQPNLVAQLSASVAQWLDREGEARSTLAGAIVVLDKLHDTAPVGYDMILTSGGQVVGARGQALRTTLQKYGLPSNFLADGVTTRSTERFRRLIEDIDFGKPLVAIPIEHRKEVVDGLVALVVRRAKQLLLRQHLAITCDRQDSPVRWIREILEAAHDRSGGRVEQHLVGAKLECRFGEQGVNRLPAFAADMQTERKGDFVIGSTVYHITVSPTRTLIQKCLDNLARAYRPVILVPRDAVERAEGIAAYENVEGKVTIFAIEDFIAQNLIEMADVAEQPYFETLSNIVDAYNRRIEEAETDSSLRIELR